MSSERLIALRLRRKALGNPYAYMDELIEIEEIRRQKRQMQDPYAFVEQLESSDEKVLRFDGLTVSLQQEIDTKPRRVFDGAKASRAAPASNLESAVKRIHVALWQQARSTGVTDPFEILDPVSALRYLGFEVVSKESLGTYTSENKLIEVAGSIDVRDKLVRLSNQPRSYVQNFTAAHELGHAVLHEGIGFHRDRAVSGVRITRDINEAEADRFAALFLMPGKLVTTAFEQKFGASPFTLREETLFALGKDPSSDPTQAFRTTRELSTYLSALSTYNGMRFTPLKDQFRVSVQTMAIRLEELSLVQTI